MDCAAADDLNIAVGDDTDPNVVASLEYFSTGACPVSSLPGGQNKVTSDEAPPKFDHRGPPWWEIAGAF